MSKFKKISLTVVLAVLLFVSMCPTFAFASSLTPIVFNFSKPYVSNTTGYVAIKGERTDLNNAEQAFILYYQISPVANSTMSYESDNPVFVVEDIYSNAIYFNVIGDVYTDYHISVIIMHQNGTVQSVLSDDFENDFYNGVFYFNPSFLITNIDTHGNIDRSALESDYDAFDYIFTEDKYEYMYLLSIFNVLVEYGDLKEDELELLQSIVDSGSSIETILNELKTTFSEKLDTIIADNEVFKERLQFIYNKLRDIYNISYAFFYDDFPTYMFLLDEDLVNILLAVDNLEEYTDEIESLLQQILDALNVKGESNLTSPDTSQLDNYYEIEQGLVNRSDVDVSNAVNVQIDQNAMAFTWNMIDSFLNSNGKVIGLFLTVLSLGIIALILGR